MKYTEVELIDGTKITVLEGEVESLRKLGKLKRKTEKAKAEKKTPQNKAEKKVPQNKTLTKANIK